MGTIPPTDQPSGERQPSSRWKRIALPVVLVAMLVATGLALFSDAGDLSEAFRRFNWWLIIPVLALTTWNYGWRFLKWQMYLHAIDVDLPAGVSARIFIGGFAMSLTPGKVGELIKAIYIRRMTGVRLHRTGAAVAAERITDALAMLILAGIGATQYEYARPFLGLMAVLAVAGIVVIQRPEMVNRQIIRLSSVPVIGRVTTHGTVFIGASGALFRPQLLIRAVVIGLISWTGECLAFFLVLVGLGIDPTRDLFLIATFILAVSSLAGGASLLPGGLGVADAGIAGLLVLLIKDPEMTHGLAAAATLIIRFATLWFAVILGVIALAGLERRWGRVEPVDHPLQSTAQDSSATEATSEPSPAGYGAVGDGGNL